MITIERSTLVTRLYLIRQTDPWGRTQTIGLTPDFGQALRAAANYQATH